MLTILSLLAFAGNSVLCRLALKQEAIDEASFTVLRLLAGSAVLLSLWRVKKRESTRSIPGSKGAALALFLYAICFSLAYRFLDTGTGALILFASVQLTMVGYAVAKGAWLNWLESSGLLLAFAGFVVLILPSAASPSFIGLVLMSISGVAWGFYSVRGRRSVSPLGDTAGNFLRTLPWCLLVLTVMVWRVDISIAGVLLALASGALTSGLGYAVWYSALAGLSVTQAAVVQLFVPVIAIVGGVIFNGESPSLIMLVSTSAVLVGIALVALSKKAKAAP